MAERDELAKLIRLTGLVREPEADELAEVITLAGFHKTVKAPAYLTTAFIGKCDECGERSAYGLPINEVEAWVSMHNESGHK